MPNLKSMSKAKGYTRLDKKSSQNEMCSCEIVRNSRNAHSNLHVNDWLLEFKFMCRMEVDLKAALFVP